ncbi:C39 family peptidase [Candidatus Enterococcus clewellii]|uniref:Peptidase C39-like domain-containing protein n=1 Tax=Candidatus Enterococcus clewellii TaxID=1834193 RepID=A0A242K946_9ENTE|nr:C39 family peptidase [Enterococcus sp. 9E7_DIV0242]OTP17691.1 hypothetical protein A5888_001829 [Enterococcus sp. 9E7_DIV0242]
METKRSGVIFIAAMAIGLFFILLVVNQSRGSTVEEVSPTETEEKSAKSQDSDSINRGDTISQRSYESIEENQLTETSESSKESSVKPKESETVLGVDLGRKEILNLSTKLQETNYYCVPATVQMLLEYFDIDVQQEILAEKMNTDPISGTEYIDLVKVVNSYLFDKQLPNDNESGYHIQTITIENTNEIQGLFEKRVKTNVDTGYPTFAAVNLNKLYEWLPEANHMVLVIGYATYKDSEEIAFYYINDPYPLVHDSTFDGLKVFTKEELLMAITQNEEPAYIW